MRGYKSTDYRAIISYEADGGMDYACRKVYIKDGVTYVRFHGRLRQTDGLDYEGYGVRIYDIKTCRDFV